MNNIICFSSTRWNFLIQRPQQLMKQFAGEFRVAYVNPPIVIKSFGTKPSLREYCQEINNNLIVYTPPRPASLSGPRVQNYFRQILGRFIEEYGFSNPLLWFNMPEAAYLCGAFGEKMVVYDCLDDFKSFSWTPEYTARADQLLTQKADVVVVVSEALYTLKASENPKTFLIPNACDFDHFYKALTKIKVPEELKKIKRPRIGFIGALYEWVDSELLKHMAEERPEWSIVLVGPTQEGLERINLPNIYYLGRKSYRMLPNYLKGFDVCIIPFRNSQAALNSSPVKLYEYLASGKPVVSTGIPQVSKFSRVVEIASDRREFIDKVQKVLQERPEDKKMRQGLQLGIARANTWEVRYNNLKKIPGLNPTEKNI